MTLIDVDTSPLQAAREWRGINLVQASMNSGLPMTQAEALEDGDPDAFGSIDEMIAAAVVYGASIGIGRDEAMALLDRTVLRSGVQVALPERPNESFSSAVAERSARIASRPTATQAIPVEPMPRPDATPVTQDVTDHPVHPGELDVSLPLVPARPAAGTSSPTIQLGDDSLGAEPWSRGDASGELATWVGEFDGAEADARPVPSSTTTGAGRMAQVGDNLHAGLERMLGADRADAIADWTSRSVDRVGELTRDGRERLRRSEHATLFVAIGAGALLIALLVAIGGALGGSDDPAGPGPAKRSAGSESAASLDSTAGTTTAPAAPAPAAKPAATPTAMLPPAKITVDVFNSGSRKGRAKEVAAQLDAAGYRIDRVTNARDYSGAAIIHPKTMEREARVLARRTGVTTLQVAPGSTSRITVVVA